MADTNKSILKTFTQKEMEQLLHALNMAQKSLDRRINAESDEDAKNVWQTKLDMLNVLASKLRLTEPTK